MIILGCIEFHSKGCARWIIVLMDLIILLITRNLIQKILVDAILVVHVRGVKIKSFLILMLSWCIFYKKNFMEKYLCSFAHEEPYVPYKIMIEKMIMLTSSSNNVYGVINDNSNRYRSMVMNVIRMNQDDINECSIVDEESNVDTTIFLVFWKILRYYYEMDTQIIVNYQSLYMRSPSSQIMGWVRLIMTKSSNRREEFYLEGLGWKRASMLLNPWWNPLA